MSREIKFRVWDKKRKRYAKVIQTTNQGWKGYRDKTYITNGIMRFSKWVLSRFIIEQYTGLKDKNGKEICEGDIVRQYGLYVYEVKRHKSGAWTIGIDHLYCTTQNCKVIGNIHENPELLKPWNAAELEGNR